MALQEKLVPSAKQASPFTVRSTPVFDPKVHLAYEPPSQRLSMGDLGLDEAHNGPSSAIAVTAPFPLASREGVIALRQAILDPAVLSHCLVYSHMTGPHAQLRGMAPHAAEFVAEFWQHPETLKAISEAAGEELVPYMDIELGHTNIQVPKGMSRVDYMRGLDADPFAPPSVSLLSDEAGSKTVNSGDRTAPLVVDYHKDAYPWVAVLMLSDVSKMTGGETALRKGDGSLFKARAPSLGSIVVMRGGSITHCALPCEGASERITMVTSFRPRHSTQDFSNLHNIIDCSNLNELYEQWTEARLDILGNKLKAYKQVLANRRRRLEARDGVLGGLREPTVDLEELHRLTDEINEHMSRTLSEMAPYTSSRNVWTPKPRIHL
ncbi:hypothetical protein CBOM_03271 [Ceraceosorus bombacis]|uniref:Fe2OG dioxygenase domain-containing protein n=1 Tax=Ceraceosorus bombacis TaxID=401625 RepID=A0A0N7LAQ1_9BASI|nr:hypothetical protein CBOM_03271 [Ceraceosorus bombacis]